MKKNHAMLLSLVLSAAFASNAMAQTLAPARELLEGMGFVSQWDAESKTAVSGV